MKKLLIVLSFIICGFSLSTAQNVTRTQHRAALTQDAVTTGTFTIRQPDYIGITTDGGREQLIMDGTTFTMTMGDKQHVTDSRKNTQFATFHAVLKAVINHQPIPSGDDLTVNTRDGQTTITITPAKKKRQLFSSFVLTIDSSTFTLLQLCLNERAGNYIRYEFSNK